MANLDVLTARGDELEGELAFGSSRQLFEAPLGRATAKARAGVARGEPAELSASLFASAPAASSPERGAESSFAMLHGLYWLAANFASRNPTCLSSTTCTGRMSPSLRWLIYLARRLEGLSRLLLLGTGHMRRPTHPASWPRSLPTRRRP